MQAIKKIFRIGYNKIVSLDQRLERLVDQFFPKNLKQRYVVGLINIAILLTIAHIFLQVALTNQANDIKKVRVVDRLVSKVENIDRDLLELQLSKSLSLEKQNIKNLQTQVLEISNALSSLQEDWSTIGVSSANINKSKRMMRNTFISAKDLADKFSEISEQLKPNKNTRPEKDLLYQKLETLDLDLTKLKEKLVLTADAIEVSLSERINSFKKNELIVLGLLFALILFEGLYVFRPGIQRLYHALDARSNFLSRVSHEIRNPMNAILGISDLLSKNNVDPSQIQLLKVQKQASNALLDLLNNILLVSEIDTYKVTLDEEEFDLCNTIDSVIDIYLVSAYRKGLSLKLDFDLDINRCIKGDELKLKQILMNLVGNAIKFTSKGYVRITVKKVNGGINFIIEDSGKGIEESKITKVFDSFSQEDSSVKREYGGSGLGLYIVNSFVEVMGGTIRLMSKEGKGTKCDLYIPLQLYSSTIREDLLDSFRQFNAIYVYGEKLIKYLDKNHLLQHVRLFDPQDVHNISNNSILIKEDLGGSILSEATSHLFQKIFLYTDIGDLGNSYANFSNIHYLSYPYRLWDIVSAIQEIKTPSKNTKNDKSLSFKRKILIVDDSEENRLILSIMLEDLGIDHDQCANGLEAIQNMSIYRYDLVLMDIQMPRMDGYEAMQKLQDMGSKVPVVAITAHDTKQERNKILKAGFKYHLIKPVTFERLRDYLYNFKSDLKYKEESPNQDSINRIEEKVKQARPKYIQNRKKDILIIQDAMANGDFDKIKSIGHKMKGNAISFGFTDLSEIGKGLEQASVNRDLEQIKNYFDSFKEYMKNV